MQLSKIFSDSFAERSRILYGGSTNAENISGFLKEKDIDGALVGGASLNAEEFINMIEKAIEVYQ